MMMRNLIGRANVIRMDMKGAIEAITSEELMAEKGSPEAKQQALQLTQWKLKAACKKTEELLAEIRQYLASVQ
jgi:hypothetical protein